MNEAIKIRWGWLKFMYAYTVITAGGIGLGMIVLPGQMQSLLGWPAEESITFGLAASIFLAVGFVSIFGLRSPLKFVPVLFLQLLYKLVWYVGVILPWLVSGRFPSYAIATVLFWLTFIVGDLIAIPFPYLFAKEI
ncbi:MAG: hypothetical protein C3F13_09465 [Anaerolineales bacterium]|nr:hypothetical protein [Anaerolineae bacterium]PWB53361.1 MAG: hypothetical protein C3F13_09465 [Anaerolineales bacterium]